MGLPLSFIRPSSATCQSHPALNILPPQNLHQVPKRSIFASLVNNNVMKILVTGAAGFIGSALSARLAQRGDEVIGLDNINDYYDIRLKYGRLQANGFACSADDIALGEERVSRTLPNFRFVRMNLHDRPAMEALFAREHFDQVVNLAAQAGVRYSITNPYAYLESNLVGFVILLECCRHHDVRHLVFASSSSVYGLNEKVPYNEQDPVDSPVSLYAASKKSNELMAHAYSKLYGIAMSGLRYFTVYGPWGRPDMAPMLFARAISTGEPIHIFNNGQLQRDFTYIDDIVEGTLRVIDHSPVPEACPHQVPYQIYNIGCSHPIQLMDFIREMEQALGTEAKKVFLPMQPGDVLQTYADTGKLETQLDYQPRTRLHEGISRFVAWYKSDANPLQQT